MQNTFILFILAAIIILANNKLFSQSYPDQHVVLTFEDLKNQIETQSGIELSSDSIGIKLADSSTSGYIILKPDTAEFPFNRGLPSWNGSARDNNCGFLIQMRFPDGDGWSPWLTVGFWKAFIWNSYGSTSYSGGFIDYDYVKLYQYQQRWQFKVNLKRYSVDDPSPTIHKLSFYISDKVTTDNTDYMALLNDNPDEIFIPTDFLYQYAIDEVIGGSICSPTSVSMALLSYDITVDPLEFARGTRDPYYGIFGIWPRVVQHASEYGLDGAVTRYRSWSAAREVLAAGGRIVIPVGPPLYQGHLMMLAGFTSEGNPIVHDPAKTDGYGKVYNKNDLGISWFSKGGIAYTFFPRNHATTIEAGKDIAGNLPESFQLNQNFPNPFNPITTIPFSVPEQKDVKIAVYDVNGRLVETVYDGLTSPGNHSVIWDAEKLASGNYFIVLSTSDYYMVKKALLLK